MKKDLVIFYRNKQIVISTEFLSTILLYQSFGNYFIESGRTEFSTDINHKCIDTKMDIGEQIMIKVLEKGAHKSSELTLTELIDDSKKSKVDEDFPHLLLRKFRTLEKLLLKEGLIQSTKS